MRRHGRLAVAVALGLALAGCSSDAGRRESLSAAAEPFAELPVPRTEVAGVTWRGRLAVVGGLTADGGASDVVHFWGPGDNRWVAGPPLPRPLHHSALVVLDDRLWAIGGYTNAPGRTWEPQRLAVSLGDGDKAWRQEVPLPTPLGGHAAAVVGDLIVVMGGESGGLPLATTSVYDPAVRTWRRGPDLGRPREHLAAASAGGRVYAIAGRTATEGNFTVVESLAPGTGTATTWRTEPDLIRPRGGIGADAVGATVCVVGGEEPAGTIGPVECLTGGQWQAVADLARPRHGLAVMALDGRLHVVGGGEQPGLFVSGVHEVVAVASALRAESARGF
ncbi:MAG: DUF1668 domain-containing protein [Acidimicrobiales bacterium]